MTLSVDGLNLHTLYISLHSDIFRPIEGPSRDQVSAVYIVHGSVVGHTTLTATAHLPSGQTIYSAPKPIEVCSSVGVGFFLFLTISHSVEFTVFDCCSAWTWLY